MAISYLRNWIGRRRPVWLAAILFASMLAIGSCMATPAVAGTTAAPASDCPMLQNGMPKACCLNFNPAAHAIAIPVSDATPHLSAPPAGHAAIAMATFPVPTVQVNRSLRPPIRAPAVPAQPIYLLNCALLN